MSSTSLFKRLYRWLIALVWYTFALTVVLTAAGFGVARLMLPYASEYTADIEKQMSASLGQPVKVSALDAEFIGFTPTLVLKDVAMYNKKNTAVLLRFPKIRIGLNVLDSLIYQQIIFERFDLAGINLYVQRDQNGDFSVRGVEVAAEHDKKSKENLEFGDWIFTHSHISLELSNLVFVDHYQANKTYQFNNVSVLLNNDGERHQISSVFRFPDKPDKELTIYIDNYGNPLDWKHWNGKIYAQGSQIDIDNFVSTKQLGKFSLQPGPLDFEMWADIGDANLKSLQGKIASDEIRVWRSDGAFKSESPLHYTAVNSAFKWEKLEQGWTANVKDFRFSSALGEWPNSSFTVTLQNSESAHPSFAVHISHFHLDEINPLLNYFSEYLAPPLQFLRQYKYLGVVRNVNLQTAYENKVKWYLNGEFDQVAVGAVDKSLALSGLSGDVTVAGDNGNVTLRSDKAKIVYPAAFDHSVALGRVDASVNWQFDAAKTQVTIEYLDVSNESAEMSTQGKLLFDSKGPFFDLSGALHRFDIKNIPDYLPLRRLSAGSADWLRMALIGGRLSAGEFVWKGRPQLFPYGKKNGEFDFTAQVEDGVLRHGKEWPVISRIQGEIGFNGRHLYLRHANGEVLQAPLREVTVDIADLTAEQVMLKIDGMAPGKTQSKIDYLLQSGPLRKRYANLVGDLHAQGDSNLKLKLDIGLSKDGPLDFAMDLSLLQNEFSLTQSKPIFSNASGDIHISNKTVLAKNIRAILFGQESNISIETKQAEKDRLRDEFIIVTLKGYFSAPQFSQNYLPVLKDLSSGVAPWNVQVSIPLVKHARNLRGDQGVQIEVSSDLYGVELKLPKPFRKKAEQKLPLRASAVFANNHHDIYRVRLGGDLDAIVDTHRDHPERVRGEIRFGAGHSVLPNADGLYLVGQLEEFSFDIWKSLIDQIEFNYRQKAGTDSAAMPLIRSVALRIAKLDFLGQKVNNLNIKAQRLEKYTDVFVDSKAIRGRLKVPRDMKNGLLDLNLDYWNLNGSDSRSSGDIDPRNFPAIEAKIKNVTYDKRIFGQVALTATKTVEGLRLEKLTVADENTSIDGFGKWVVLSGQPSSEFQFNLKSNDIGATMQNLGYIGSIEGGSGSVSANISWPGGLPALNLEKVKGKVSFELVKGRLLEYDPLGGASILGLFSIQTLPKRLLLDFSDLYKKGLEFDSISGHFELSDGDAYTSDFLMEGSVVNASLAGRIGLVNQDYDQLIKVQVHVADFISFVGLLVSSPWSIILPQLLKDEFKTTLKYSLSGNWADPKLEPLVQDLLVPKTEEDEF